MREECRESRSEGRGIEMSQVDWRTWERSFASSFRAWVRPRNTRTIRKNETLDCPGIVNQ